MLEVQLKRFDWGSRIEVGVQWLESRSYHVLASFCSIITLGAICATCAGRGCFDQVCGDVSTRLRGCERRHASIAFRVQNIGGRVCGVMGQCFGFEVSGYQILGFRSNQYCHQRRKYFVAVTLNLNPEP